MNSPALCTTRSPSLRMARRCSPLAMNVTALPALASMPPKYPPTPPLPITAIFIVRLRQFCRESNLAESTGATWKPQPSICHSQFIKLRRLHPARHIERSIVRHPHVIPAPPPLFPRMRESIPSRRGGSGTALPPSTSSTSISALTDAASDSCHRVKLRIPSPFRRAVFVLCRSKLR